MNPGKLVRDRIPEIKKALGEKPVFHIADDEEYWMKLKAKFAEEVGEFVRDESIDEIGDVLEVIDAIMAYKQFDRDEMMRRKEAKAEERGRFGARIILEKKD